MIDCQRRYMNATGTYFGRYARFVSRNPIVFIVFPIIICGLLGVGMLHLKTISEIETLYVPINTRTVRETKKVLTLFPDTSDTNYNIQSLTHQPYYGVIIFKAKDNSDVLSAEVVQEISNICIQIKDFTFKNNGLSYSYYNVCAMAYGECAVSGEFLLAPGFLLMYQAGNVTYPTWINSQGIPVDLTSSINGHGDSNNRLKSVSAIRLSFNLRQNDMSLEWESEFLKYMNKLSTNLSDVAYSASSSINKELDANIGQDLPLFALSLVLLIIFAFLVMTGGNCVSSRSFLAQGGVLTVFLAILAAFGIFSAAGLGFVDIIGVMPFLAIGVGVDTMFIIMSEWAEHHNTPNVEDQMEATLSKCGGSIAISSLTDITTFFIGVSSRFISIRNFCAYTGLALLFSYILHMTFFLGCLSIHGRRVRNKRHCVTCLQSEDKYTLTQKGYNTCAAIICSGKPPQSREDDESLCEKIPRMCLTTSILQTATKVIVILLFIGYLTVSIWGVMNLKQGLTLNNLANDNSYYQKFHIWHSEYFKTTFAISFNFQNINYLDTLQVQLMCKLLTTFQQEPWFLNNPMLCWYHLFAASSDFNTSSEAQFITNLKMFLKYRPFISDDVVFSDNGTSILTSRCHLFTIDLPESSDQGHMMTRLREITDGSVLDVFAFSPLFIFFEQYTIILSSTLQTVGIAIVCVMVITIIFMPHPIMVVLVTGNMISILVGIFGFLHIWDLTLSSITMIHLIMSVGFSVDFSVHVCHGFMKSAQNTRNGKAIDALRTSAAPVINGGVSSLLGICTLIASQSYVFRAFLKIMILVIGFGLTHSMLLLPVMLSLIGPVNSKEISQNYVEEIPMTNRSKDKVEST